MKKLMMYFLIPLLLSTGCAKIPTTGAAGKEPPLLFVKTDKKGFSNSDRDIAYIKGINATTNLRLLESGQRFRVPLPDKQDIVIEERRRSRSKNAITWYGEVVGARESFVMLTYTPKALSGRIVIGKEVYRVLYTGNGIYQIALLNNEKMTEADNDAMVPKYKKLRGNEADGCPDPATDIDVMVVFTQAAEDGAGGPEGMEAFIYECLELTNLCYENSDINQRMNLVHFTRVTYTESGDAFDDRAALQDPADGQMDNIHTLRNTYGADLVALLVETSAGTNCGYAYIMDPVDNAHEAWAFGAIRRSCAVDNLSFPHELGHIMSARHHDDGNTTPFAYGHGFQAVTPADPATTPWRTVMSKIGGTTRIPFFSNPGMQFPLTGTAFTDPMGTAASNDNHRTLNNTAATIANFRCSSPGIGNVWMKDAWEDSGVEPDPATAGMAMWRSPYIWVRNNRDATFAFAHQHENPLFGSANWIYVKMHNGNAAPQTGNLELYIADASLSLSWPGGWTLVATVPLTIGGSSTRIVEQQWNSVPDPSSGSTHYCMIARWVSASDPMHTPEGSDINQNVRENNNIIWRNLNVVCMGCDGDESKVTMNISAFREIKTYRLVFEDITKFPRPKFTATGTVSIQVDDQLAALWKQAGAKNTGLKSTGGTTFQMSGSRASIDNLPLPYNYKGKITLIFKRAANTPKLKYLFSVQQQAQNERNTVIGGVDYELVPKK